jgi:hypothetical protein
MLLDELLARLTELPEKSRDEAINLAVQSTATMAWVPNPGPQTQAFLCEADELLYGGEAGGGKTDLGIGLALTSHKGRARRQVESFAAERGLVVAGVYVENASGASLSRPELFRLIRDSKPGDVLLLEQVDRLTRLTEGDWQRLLGELKEWDRLAELLPAVAKCGRRAQGSLV